MGKTKKKLNRAFKSKSKSKSKSKLKYKTTKNRVKHASNSPNKHGSKYEKNGWIYISIDGSPRERGFANGYLVADELADVQKMLEFTAMQDFGIHWSFFVDACTKYLMPTIKRQFHEFYEEMEGISEGATAAGTPMTLDEVCAWNNYFTLTESWVGHMPPDEAKKLGIQPENKTKSREGGTSSSTLYNTSFSKKHATDKCSAFIAVGKDWTADGKIVVAHNNFANFIDGQFARTVTDLRPDKGARILMMGYPGWIWSGTDFFVTSAGFIGTETTIGGFHAYENNVPICCRIRNAMQYGKSLDEYEHMLLDGNSGDYANSWLFGDINRNEIMRIELGLQFHNTERTSDGYFIGFNAAYDPQIRNLECSNSGFNDVRRHQGARKVRLEQLMMKYKGKLTAAVAKKILADHYDVYLNKANNPCSRTVCSHYELDGREFMSDPSRPLPYQPRGALDGNVCDSAMANKMSFSLRWGDSCGLPFRAAEFFKKHAQWEQQEPYLRDRLTQPWTMFSATK